jgi:putative membrane protein
MPFASDPSFWNRLTAVALATSGFLYARGLIRLWASGAGRKTVRRWHAASFAAGWLSLVIALLSKLDALSDILFSAHMAQHEILMLVAAPLMVMGRPFIVMLWSMGAPKRAMVAAAIRRMRILRAWSALTTPFTVVILHAAVLWLWHVPALFESALHHEAIHAFQHLGFFVVAVLFWWSLIHGRFGRMGYGAAVLYLFATAMQTQVLGALLTFGMHAWYPTHAMRAGAHAVDDQQFAGVVMWVPFGIVFVLVGLALFAAWLGEAERRVAFTQADRLTRDA